MSLIKKIFVGNSKIIYNSEGAISRRVKNLRIIWNNEYHEDVGIERLLRLFLAASQFVFLGTYLRELFGKTTISRDLSIDFLVVFKIAFSLVVVKYGLYNNWFCLGILIWFLLETVLYIPTLIFASDYLSRPRSYRRAMILFFFNFIEVNLSYASLYSKFGILNKENTHWFDSVYFSFVVSSSTGFGDLYPVDFNSKLILVSHTIISIMFIVLFLNSFSSKMEITGYFQDK
jgi:hypothetical protein